MRLQWLSAAGLLLASSTFAEVSGDEYIVLFDNDSQEAANFDNILKQVNLNPSSPRITHVFNNSAFSGFIAQLDKAHVTDLNALAQVKTVEESKPVRTHLTAVQGQSPWGLERISQVGTVTGGNFSGLDYKYSYDPDSQLGRGVDVYVVDTGVNTAHEAFTGRAQMVYSIKGNSDLNAGADQDGHGTHVSGTCCGKQYGVAPNTNIFGVKVLGADGSGSSSDCVKGIDFVVQNHDNRKTQSGFIGSIASMSWGLGGRSTSVEQAITSAVQAGIHMVVAAGNDGSDACSSSPSAMGGTGGTAISVGSFGESDGISSFSNTGKCVDLYAPGENVLSTYMGSDTATKILSGTSMATPHTTGVIATLMTHYTNLRSPAAMKQFIANIGLRGALDSNSKVSATNLVMLNNGQRGAGLGGANLGNSAVTTITIHPTVTQHVTAIASATGNPGNSLFLVPSNGNNNNNNNNNNNIDNSSGSSSSSPISSVLRNLPTIQPQPGYPEPGYPQPGPPTGYRYRR